MSHRRYFHGFCRKRFLIEISVSRSFRRPPESACGNQTGSRPQLSIADSGLPLPVVSGLRQLNRQPPAAFNSRQRFAAARNQPALHGFAFPPAGIRQPPRPCERFAAIKPAAACRPLSSACGNQIRRSFRQPAVSVPKRMRSCQSVFALFVDSFYTVFDFWQHFLKFLLSFHCFCRYFNLP